MKIKPYSPDDREAVVHLSLRAWAPVFASIEAAMDAEVYYEMHPDWRQTQQEAVEAACTDADLDVWVALEEGQVVGFSALRCHIEDRLGEIYMIAVDPDYQRRGIAKALTNHAIEQLKAKGMTVATVDTGGDPGHAPARATYEAAGFRVLPVARYFRKL